MPDAKTPARAKTALAQDTVLFRPDHESRRLEGVNLLIDPEAPNWIVTDTRGAAILARFDGERTFGDVVHRYARDTGLEFAKAWQHVETITRDALRHKYLIGEEVNPREYDGRNEHLRAEPLRELWIHTNNSCNLACRHCLVSSGPDGDRGLASEKIVDIIRQARALGAHRFYFTGGEPFVRKDLFELIDEVLSAPDAELAILTNGVLLTGRHIDALRERDTERLRLQISLDGSAPEINDPIRGAGTFARIVAGIRAAFDAGIATTVSTAIAEANADDVADVTRLVASLGVKNHHLLWLHKRGRAGRDGEDRTPSVEKVTEVVRAAQRVAAECGIVLDNCESVKGRLRSTSHVKYDLASACVSSLCVYSDGQVYPSAAMANVPELALGSVLGAPLERVWRDSPVAREFRAATVKNKEICRSCPLMFLCGGGDIEHAYFYGGSLLAHDPYCELHKAMFDDAVSDLARHRQRLLTNGRSGFDAPVIVAAMGEGAVHCAADDEPSAVRTTRSECELSLDVDSPRRIVRSFYGEAAESPQEDLCCPVRPEADDVAHVPEEVLDRFYGCGSPVADAAPRPGETTLDLGSGAGIDVFIAARRVGPQGRAIGVDMTDEMLEVAEACRPEVAANLGFDVAEFRKGFLEDIPVADRTVDVVTSNCVVNLSPDKKKVLAEIWRILRDHGRLVFSDIVSEREVPSDQRRDPRLWGECISGALTDEELLAYMERAGFYGVQVLRKAFWKEVEGYRFYSLTVRGFKFEKTAGCVFIGQQAVYQGPFKGVSDEEGHWFPRNVAVEVCTDTAAKLTMPPYVGQFIVTDPTRDVQEGYACCSPGGDASCC